MTRKTTKKDMVRQIPIQMTNSLNEKVPVVPTHTITREKIFLNQTHKHSWYNEADCLEYILENPSLNLFSEDTNPKLSKRFFALDYYTLYQLCIKKLFNLYENFPSDKPIKLFNDIDIKEKHIPVGKDRAEHLDDVIKQAIDLMIEHLKPYDVVDPQIIVLKSSTDTKLSAHIIFLDVVFPNIYAMKFFISEIKSDLIYNKIIDPSIYKKGCFRLLWNSKFGVGTNLEYCRSINYTHSNDEQLFMDCLLLNLPELYHYVNVKIPKNVKIITKTVTKKTALVNSGMTDDLVHKPISLLKKYVDMLDPKRADDYNHWIEIGRSLRGSNPSKECFDIWDAWSKQSDTYCTRDFNAYKWNSFGYHTTSFGYLKYYAKKDNPDVFDVLEFGLEKPNFESITFDSDYLLDKEEKILENKSFVSQHVINWMKDPTIKTLSIKSPYGTGKTALIKQIFIELGLKRVLLISYRQTLTYELHGNFKEQGVHNYLEKSFNADKLICQIESLRRLLPYARFEGENLFYPSFDLVILDESEGELNHFRSPTIDNKVSTFNIMQYIIFNSKKVLALDGDFGNRSYDYLKAFGKNIILRNLRKKNQRNFRFTNKRHSFENNIDDDLQLGRKLVVVSLSARIAMLYYNKYKDKYRVVIHTSKSDDILKEKLRDVEKFWTEFDLVIYSPSVEAGVSFDVDHFDKMYVILSNESTSPRGLLQMCSRVRRLKYSDIDVYLNNLPYKEKANFFSYDEIKEYICDVYRTYLEPKTVYNAEEQKMEIKYEFDLYAQILVHNETENANKCRNRFVAYFISMLTEKGHTYENPDDNTAGKSYNKENILKDMILKARDIDDNEFKLLMGRQIANKGTQEEKFITDKHAFKKEWGIQTLTVEFNDMFHGKTPVLRNLRRLNGIRQIDPYLDIDDPDGKYAIDFDNAYDLQKDGMIKDLIKTMGFKTPIDDTSINREAFEKKIKVCIAKCQLFINTNKSEQFFRFDSDKLKSIVTIKQFMGFINSILKEYGIAIKTTRKDTRHKTNGKWVTDSEYLYKLRYVDGINNYI